MGGDEEVLDDLGTTSSLAVQSVEQSPSYKKKRQRKRRKKHPVKKDVAIPRSQTSGVPVLLIPQLETQEEPLHGMA